MSTIFVPARHILRIKGEMSSLKLQKLCYYSQAWTMVWDDKPLFNEDFEAWVNGPVCRVLWEYFKGRFTVKFKDIGNEYDDINELTEKEKSNIKSVVDYYGDKTPQYLSDLTHMEDPWKEARKGYAPMEQCNKIITKQSMALYYGSL